MLDSLTHHGIKGQKWGVRRYQNKDGSLTRLGITRNRAMRAAKTKKDVDDIVKTMSEHDKDLLELDKNHRDEYMTLDEGEWVVKRFLTKEKNTPVAFFDFLRDGDDLLVSLGTRSGDQYRGKGYATKLAKQGMKWAESHKDLWDNLVWGARSDNTASKHMAEKLGFKYTRSWDRDNATWDVYKYKKE